MYLFECKFCLGICPDVGLLDHVVVPDFIFWGTSKVFSIVVVPVYRRFCCVAQGSMSNHLWWNMMKDKMRMRVCTDVGLGHSAVEQKLTEQCKSSTVKKKKKKKKKKQRMLKKGKKQCLLVKFTRSGMWGTPSWWFSHFFHHQHLRESAVIQGSLRTASPHCSSGSL